MAIEMRLPCQFCPLETDKLPASQPSGCCHKYQGTELLREYREKSSEFLNVRNVRFPQTLGTQLTLGMGLTMICTPTSRQWERPVGVQRVQ
jgi:hypothetical protein